MSLTNALEVSPDEGETGFDTLFKILIVCSAHDEVESSAFDLIEFAGSEAPPPLPPRPKSDKQ
jgi:hypothetical protein